ncbi:Pr6Pr family membrane protein [Pontibacter qinzhouensis]|nr:Pr6Pr family membrane protein [Pontibacter qinzhouensis]
MLENRTASTAETIIRFFSFFTILTNSLAAIYFTVQAVKPKLLHKAGALTALTVYITIVGAVYQLLLRHIWEPTGLQRLVDELLHTINPLLVIGYWYVYEKAGELRFKQIGLWLLYPMAYLIFILVRGSFSNFYPYPFIHVAEIEIRQALTNSFMLLLVFIVTAAVFIFVGQRTSRKHLWREGF